MHLGLMLGIGSPFGPGGAAAEWEATSISNLVDWFRASRGVTLVSGKVSSWADQSGNGDSNRNLTQGTAGTRPTFNASDANFNGKPSLDFGGSHFLESGVYSGGPIAQPTTIYLVGRFDDVTTPLFIFDAIDGAARQAIVFSGGWDLFAGLELIGGSPATGTTYVLCAVLNGGSSALYVNRYNTTTSSGGAGTNGLRSLRLGANFGSASALDGQVAERIAYSAAHDATTRQTVMTALGTLYGVSVSA